MRRLAGNIIALIGESSWVLFCFFGVVALAFGALFKYLPGAAEYFESTIGQFLAGGLVYGLVLGVVVLPIWLMRGSPYVARILGIAKKPPLSIVWLPLLLWFIYMTVTVVMAAIMSYLQWIDVSQEQNIGFDNLGQLHEYLLAFVALVILPPIAEELLFRGYLFGRLRERFGFWVTTLTVSGMFGLVHMQWNVGIDVAILSIFLCYLREKTGSVWASMVLHSLKNAFAYFLLFIAPLIGLNLV